MEKDQLGNTLDEFGKESATKRETLTILKKINPLLELMVGVNKICPDKTRQFFMYMEKVSVTINENNYDIIYIPERGGTVLQRTLETFATLDNKKLNIVSMPIGTHTFFDNERDGGLNKMQKFDIIKRYTNLSLTSTPHPKKILLIDEVQSGGTSKFAIHAVRRCLPENTLIDYIGCKDENNLHRKKASGYSSLINGKSLHINKGYEFIMPMPFIDKSIYLNTLMYPLSKDHYIQNKKSISQTNDPIQGLKIINTDAKEMMSLLTHLYKDKSSIQNIRKILGNNKEVEAEVNEWLEAFINH